MVVTLLEENQIQYDTKAVEDWMNVDTIENEGIALPKQGIPSTVDASLLDHQRIDHSGMYSLHPVTVSTSILTAFAMESKKDCVCVVLKECPFFPAQAGQEGDTGTLTIQNTHYPIINTVSPTLDSH